MKQLAKDSTVLSIVSMGEMVLRFVRTKSIALILGPAGTGFLAQLTIFFETLRIFGDLGARRAVIKQVAEEGNKERGSERYREIVWTSYFLVVTASCVVAVLVTLFAGQISQLLYGSNEHGYFITALAFLLPIASVSTVTASIVKGNLEFASFAKYTLGSYCAVILLTPALIYFFHYWGAVAVYGLFFIFPLIGYLFLDTKRKFLMVANRLSWDVLKQQFFDGSLQIYQTALMQAMRLLVAAWIIRELSLASMGIYQVVITFTTVYLAIPLQAMTSYMFPTIAAAKSMSEVNERVNDSFRFLTFLLAPLLVCLIILPQVFIRIFFSGEFLAAVPVMQVQIIHSLFVIWAASFMSALVAKGKFKEVFIASTAHAASFFLVLVLLFAKFELMGVAVAFAVAGAVQFCLYFYYCVKHFSTLLLPKNVKLVAASGLWIALAVFVGLESSSWTLRILVLFLGIPWFFLASKDHERHFLWQQTVGIWERIYVWKS